MRGNETNSRLQGEGSKLLTTSTALPPPHPPLATKLSKPEADEQEHVAIGTYRRVPIVNSARPRRNHGVDSFGLAHSLAAPLVLPHHRCSHSWPVWVRGQDSPWALTINPSSPLVHSGWASAASWGLPSTWGYSDGEAWSVQVPISWAGGKSWELECRIVSPGHAVYIIRLGTESLEVTFCWWLANLIQCLENVHLLRRS